MKKKFDIKNFITIVTMLLFSYCIVLQLPIPEELKYLVYTVVGFFLGSKVQKIEE